MNRVNQAMAALLRRSMQVVPAERREWVEAVWSEAGEVPPGWRQLNWLAGGLRMTVREAALARRLRYPLVPRLATVVCPAGVGDLDIWCPLIVIDPIDPGDVRSPGLGLAVSAH